ncbi:MAG: hypothetical protein ACRD5H_01505 [Nitrososphaerales archaeon]
MGFITRVGSYWGFIPQTSGRVFWVAPAASYTVEGRSYGASDQNDGLSPERALLTLDTAIGLTTASVGDVIVLLPGTHTMAATATIDVAGLTITGIPQGPRQSRKAMAAGGARMRSIVTASATITALTVTAADTEIAYLHFTGVASTSSISISNAADRAYVHDCTFNMTTAGATDTFGISFPLGTGTTTVNDQSHVQNCFFYIEGNQGPAIRAAGTVLGLTIDSSTFSLAGDTAWDDAIEIILAGSVGNFVRDCDFVQAVSGTVITDCIDVTGSTTDGATAVYRCYAPAGSDLIEATATADVYAAESYLATTTGGALTGST